MKQEVYGKNVAEIICTKADIKKPEPASPEFEKCWLRWRAVSIDENRVKKAIIDLAKLPPTSPSEFTIQKEQHAALGTELAQITGRKDWLATQMGVDALSVAERRFTVEEMTESRQPPDSVRDAERVTEIARTNQEVDALIAKCRAPATETLADQIETVQQAPFPPRKSTSKPRVTWRDLAWDYVVETYSSRPFKTAHTFYGTLVNKVGNETTPFTLHGRELFLADIGQSVSEKTIQNNMKEIKKAALCKKPNP